MASCEGIYVYRERDRGRGRGKQNMHVSLGLEDGEEEREVGKVGERKREEMKEEEKNDAIKIIELNSRAMVLKNLDSSRFLAFLC